MDILSTYTRSQAIEDGVLIDVSELAREAGFRLPVAVTAGAWTHCVQPPKGLTGQDHKGRLWDLLFVLKNSIATSSDRNADYVQFCVHVRNHSHALTPVALWGICEAGDNGEPALTVMLPDEY